MSTLTGTRLEAWIEELRGRLERGELADHPPIQLQPWSRITQIEAQT